VLSLLASKKHLHTCCMWPSRSSHVTSPHCTASELVLGFCDLDRNIAHRSYATTQPNSKTYEPGYSEFKTRSETTSAFYMSKIDKLTGFF
jgi:hypothetical protein